MPSPFHGRVPGLGEAEQVPGSRREVTGQVRLQVTSSSARGRSEVSVGQDRAVSVGGEAGRLLCRRELLWPGAGRAVAWEGPPEGVPDAAHPCCRPLAFLPAAPPTPAPTPPDAALSPPRTPAAAAGTFVTRSPSPLLLHPGSTHCPRRGRRQPCGQPSGSLHLHRPGRLSHTALRAPLPAGTFLFS